MGHRSHIEYSERQQIERLVQEGLNVAAIAFRLIRHRSTIHRELIRGRVAGAAYKAKLAEQMADERRLPSAHNASQIAPEIWEFAQQSMRETQAGPAQIVARMEYLGIPSCSPQTLYNRIEADEEAGGDLYKNLRFHQKNMTRTRAPDRRSTHPKTRIDKRPKEVYKRKKLGHWEVDTMHGKQGQTERILFCVERCSRLTKIVFLQSATADATSAAIIKVLKPLNPLSITSDNGTEFDAFPSIRDGMNTDYYFAYPGQPTQRATCENTIGQSRQYWPKGCSLQNVTQRDIEKVENILNNRPRVGLKGRTPNEVFFAKV
jgi:transposase, IS30 family